MTIRMTKPPVEPKDTKRIRLLLGSGGGIDEEKEALFVVQLMSREDALLKTKQGEQTRFIQ